MKSLAFLRLARPAIHHIMASHRSGGSKLADVAKLALARRAESRRKRIERLDEVATRNVAVDGSDCVLRWLLRKARLANADALTLRLLGAVRHPLFEAYAVVVTLLWTGHLLALLYGSWALWSISSGSGDGGGAGSNATTATQPAEAAAVEFPFFMLANFLLALFAIVPLYTSLQLELVLKCVKTFQFWFNVYNASRWAAGFALAHQSFLFKLYLIPAQAFMSVLWSCVDGMQLRDWLRRYIGVWLVVYWSVLMILCTMRFGYTDVNMLPIPRTDVSISALDQHQQGLGTLAIFVSKDVLINLAFPERMIVITQSLNRSWIDPVHAASSSAAASAASASAAPASGASVGRRQLAVGQPLPAHSTYVV